jgi:hypothetical protein
MKNCDVKLQNESVHYFFESLILLRVKVSIGISLVIESIMRKETLGKARLTRKHPSVVAVNGQNIMINK